MTPGAVHRGDAPRITAARAITLGNAFELHPQRFKGRLPQPPRVPEKVYINPPLTQGDANPDPPIAH
jgi:putative transposase